MIRRARMAALVFAPLAALAAVSVAGCRGQLVALGRRLGDSGGRRPPTSSTASSTALPPSVTRLWWAARSRRSSPLNGTTLNRSELLAFNPTTGVVDTNFAPMFAGGEVTAVAAAPGGTAVFVAGKFQTVNGTTQKRLVKINLSDGSINTTFKPAVSGSWVEDIQTQRQ